MSSDRDAKPVLIVEEELIDCAGLSVTQDDALPTNSFSAACNSRRMFMARSSPVLEALMSLAFSHLGALVPARAVQRTKSRICHLVVPATQL